MKRILEVGVGEIAENVGLARSSTFGVDCDFTSLKYSSAAASAANCRGPHLANADFRVLPFQSGVFDIILAKNIFGDPGLGAHDFSSRITRAVVGAAEWDKQDLIEEAARVLQSGGTLVVVESYTPEVAAKFFNNNPTIANENYFSYPRLVDFDPDISPKWSTLYRGRPSPKSWELHRL